MNSLFSFTHVVDISTPLVLSAHITNPSKNNSKVYVVFSEQIDAISASDLNNYVINNGVTVTNVLLHSDNRTVTLTTSAHADGDYVIAVSNITDDSVAANMIDTTELMYKVVSQPTNMAQKLQATAAKIIIDININTPTQPKKLQAISQ